MKHYYTDPLAAAWMARYFKMRFRGIYFSAHGQQHSQPKRETASVCVLFALAGNNKKGEFRIYIHPDSLHLLDPQEGDNITKIDGKAVGGPWDNWGNNYIIDGGIKTMLPGAKLQVCRNRSHKIIQRNGIAFMWPEVEA